MSDLAPDISWRPIGDLPEHLKDGREVLVWDGFCADVVTWLPGPRWGSEGDGWIETTEGGPIDGVTHFADIVGPERG